MNAKQKKFILNKLIPFVLREQGRGFGMSIWDSRVTPGEVFSIDGVSREIPVCGTAACIGGSTQVLAGPKFQDAGDEDLGKFLGLTYDQAIGLFYCWQSKEKSERGYAWPKAFAARYKKAKTPLGKAKVAVSLLKEVVKTNGKCLEAKKS